MTRIQAEPVADGLTMAGMADYTQLRTSYYIGALYLPRRVAEPEALLSSRGRRRMDLRVTSERWTSRRFSTQWMQALILNVEADTLSSFDDAIVNFVNLPRQALHRGDQIVIASSKKGMVSVSINGTEMFAVDKAGFFEVLLGAWIGHKPPSSEFKQAIISTVDQQLLGDFNALQPTAQRNAAVAAWVGGQELPTEAEVDEAGVGPPAAPPEAEEPALASTAALAVSIAAPVSEFPATSAMEIPAPAKIERTEPVKDKVLNGTGQTLALAPSMSELKPVVQPEIDPEIERLQQQTLLKLYRSSIIKRALREVKYPKSAIRRKQQGNVLLELTVNRSGGIVSIVERQASRYRVLNTAAVEAVRAAGELPPVPAVLEGNQIVVSIPVRFKLQ